MTFCNAVLRTLDWHWVRNWDKKRIYICFFRKKFTSAHLFLSFLVLYNSSFLFYKRRNKWSQIHEKQDRLWLSATELTSDEKKWLRLSLLKIGVIEVFLGCWPVPFGETSGLGGCCSSGSLSSSSSSPVKSTLSIGINSAFSSALSCSSSKAYKK